MTKHAKKMYRILAWVFSTIIAAGTMVGCGGKKYGPPISKYEPPSQNAYIGLMNNINYNGDQSIK